jgi:hypothetical protein
MADVDMADAPPAKAKAAKAAASSEGDKKRFEVKKVRIESWDGHGAQLTCRSGTLSLSGRGTLSLTTAPSAVTTSWTSALSARPTKLRLRARSAPSPGASAT